MRLAPRLALAALLAASYVTANRIVSRQSSDVTGDSKCFKPLCIQATVNGSEVEYVLTSTGVRTLGWMGMGWGKQMIGSPVVVMWSNSDGTLTITQRKPTAHAVPPVDSNPPFVATLQQSASDVTGSQPKFVFTVPVSTVGVENIIWAFGDTNPDSSSPDADFTQHWDMGTSSLDLSKSLSSTSSGSNPSATNGNGNYGGGTSMSKADRIFIAHGVFCVIGFLFILPLGALVARYFRTSTSIWFKAHQTIQAFLAGPVIIVGFALGISGVATEGDSHFGSTHTRLGLALFILYLAQVAIGNIIHRFKPKSALRRRPPQNYFHAVLGIIIIGIAFYQVRLGYKSEWPEITGRDPLPKAADVVYYIWVVIIPLLYIAGLGFLPRQYRQEAVLRHKETNYEMRDGTGDRES